MLQRPPSPRRGQAVTPGAGVAAVGAGPVVVVPGESATSDHSHGPTTAGAGARAGARAGVRASAGAGAAANAGAGAAGLAPRWQFDELVGVPKKAGPALPRRQSIYEKLVGGSEVASARRRACLGLLVFAALLCLAATKGLSLEVVAAWNRASIELPVNEAASRLPSLNLFDYEARYSYPIFPDEFPAGLERKIMPQMPERHPGSSDAREHSNVWREFYFNVETRGGSIGEEVVDLRYTKPLQSELSGHIVFNVLFGDNGSRIREKVEANPRFFSEHVVLVRAPSHLVGKSGERIPAGTLFDLDGHHTNEVLKHCARIQHPNLRHGYIDKEHHICGKGFRTRQPVIVIDGLHPLVVIDLALEAGASSGHGLISYNH